MVATTLLATALTSLFGASWQANRQLRGTQEAVFSSQIVQNRLEEVRSADWDQINNSTYIKTNVLKTSTLFAPALAQLQETVIVEPYPLPSPVPTPIKVVRNTNGTVTIVSTNSFASQPKVKVTVSTDWKSAVSGNTRSQATSSIVANGGITH